MTDTLETIDWETMVSQLQAGFCVPLLSNQIGFSDLFAQNIILAWAKTMGYPLDNHHVAHVAQFLHAREDDSYKTRNNYLKFLKQELWQQRCEQWRGQEHYLHEFEKDLRRLTVSEVADRLKYLNFEQQPNHPLRQLASLDIPLYLTTSHHNFIEMALKSVGKEPQTEICTWYDHLSTVNNFTPSVAMPVVYHLHGHDSDPASLVLTQDDHFDFLMALAKNFNDIIPKVVMKALSKSSVVLLGYQLFSSEFAVIFRGLIKDKITERSPRNVSIQLMPGDMPNPAAAQEFVRNYFKNYRFDIYWGDMATFIQELWDEVNQ